MSRLSDIAKAYIEFLGNEEAARRFEVKESTVGLWLKTGNYPQKVHEAADQAMEPTPTPEDGIPEAPEQYENETVELPQPANSITLEGLAAQLQQLMQVVQQQNAIATQPGHLPTSSRIEVQPNADGSMPSIVPQDQQFQSMVRPSPALGFRGTQSPVVVNAEPSPVFKEPRNPDPNHWTKPKFINRDRDRRG